MDADALKLKVIDEFKNILYQIRKGYRPNYEFILEEISCIDLIQKHELDDRLRKIMLQYYINNKCQTIY